MIRITKTEKGMIYSIDFAIAFILLLAIIVIFVLFTYNGMTRNRLELEEYSIERKRVMLLDSLVKREPKSGLAAQDLLKKRIQENRLSGTPEENELFIQTGLKKITAECGIASYNLFETGREGTVCDVIERLVYYNGQKCLLKAEYCGKL